MSEPTIDYVKGDPVVHFLEIEDTDHDRDGFNAVSLAYNRAIEKAKPFGGFKVHCREYGGGVGFPCVTDLMKCVLQARKEREG